MRLRSSLSAFLILVLLAAIGVDRAGAAQPSFDRWSVGLEAATMTWGGPPPCGMPTFKHHETELPADNIDMFVNASDKPELLPTDDCVIHVSEVAEGLDPGDACAEVVHEVGHQWGRSHVRDERNIMNLKGVDFETAGAWACRKLLRVEVTELRCGKRHSWGVYCREVYRWSLR